ncbi:hypothetical protein ILUMI_12628, partial [Ignelater luminosus]
IFVNYIETFLSSLRRGPGANVQDSCGYSSLHHAALNGHKEIVKLLLDHDASTNIVDSKGSTALHLAAWSGNVDIVRLLLCGPSICNVNLTELFLDVFNIFTFKGTNEKIDFCNKVRDNGTHINYTIIEANPVSNQSDWHREYHLRRLITIGINSCPFHIGHLNRPFDRTAHDVSAIHKTRRLY